MPGACNVHYASLLNDDATFKDADGIRASFVLMPESIWRRPVITTCGSGVTAGILSLGLALIGHEDNALYDGSWTEWGGSSELPIENGN